MSATIIYEVLLEVNSNLEGPFLEWLNAHVREMLTFEGFRSAQVTREVAPVGESVRICVQYKLKSISSFDRYEIEHASRMRAEGLKSFPQGLSATRSMWREVVNFDIGAT